MGKATETSVGIKDSKFPFGNQTVHEPTFCCFFNKDSRREGTMLAGLTLNFFPTSTGEKTVLTATNNK